MAVVLGLLVVVLPLWAFTVGPIWLGKFNDRLSRLRVGMTAEELEAVMGKPTSILRDDYSSQGKPAVIETYFYLELRESVTIVVVNGKVDRISAD